MIKIDVIYDQTYKKCKFIRPGMIILGIDHLLFTFTSMYFYITN
jgi:hypothetical protein